MSFRADIIAAFMALVGRYNADAPRRLPAGGAAGQALRKASAKDYDVVWLTDPVRVRLTGTTAADGTKVWTISPALGFDPVAVGLTVTSVTPAASARVTALSRTSCAVKAEAQPSTVSVAGVTVLQGAAPQAVAGATVSLELLPT